MHPGTQDDFRLHPSRRASGEAGSRMMHTDTPKRVLVIDDDPALLEVLSEHLKDAGYLVYLAESAAIGIRRLFESHPDLVVLDVMMPRMDGWEACARIREATDVPIVMLTAKGAPIDKLREIGRASC